MAFIQVEQILTVRNEVRSKERIIINTDNIQYIQKCESLDNGEEALTITMLHGESLLISGNFDEYFEFVTKF